MYVRMQQQRYWRSIDAASSGATSVFAAAVAPQPAAAAAAGAAAGGGNRCNCGGDGWPHNACQMHRIQPNCHGKGSAWLEYPGEPIAKLVVKIRAALCCPVR